MNSSLDITKEDCRRILRRLELETFGSLVSTFRAQGDLSKDKKKLLQDLAAVLKIPSDRQKAEIRRAVNDDKLNTVAQSLTGADSETSWALEGRRIVPVYQRWIAPTSFSLLADSVTSMAERHPNFLAPVSLERRPEIVDDKYLKEDLERTMLHPGSSKGCFHRSKSSAFASRVSLPSTTRIENSMQSSDISQDGITIKPIKRPRRDSTEYTAVSSSKVHIVAKNTSPQADCPTVVRASVPKNALSVPVSSSTPQPVSSSKSMAPVRQLAPATPNIAGRVRTRGPSITPRSSLPMGANPGLRPRFSAPNLTSTPRQRFLHKTNEKVIAMQTPTQRHIRPVYIQQTIASSTQQVVVSSSVAVTSVKNVTLSLNSPLVKTPISVANTTTVQVLQRPLLAGGVNILSAHQTIPVNKLIQASANSAILKNSGGKPNVIMISKGHPLTKAFVAQQNKDFLKTSKPVSLAPRTPLKNSSVPEHRIAANSTTSNVFVLDLRSESLSEPSLLTNILQASGVLEVEAESVTQEVTGTQEVPTSKMHISGDDILTVSSEVVIEDTPLTETIITSSESVFSPSRDMSLDEALSMLGQQQNPGARALFHCLAEDSNSSEAQTQSNQDEGIHNGNHIEAEVITEPIFTGTEICIQDGNVSSPVSSSNETQTADIFSTALASADIPMDNFDCVYMEEASEKTDAL